MAGFAIGYLKRKQNIMKDLSFLIFESTEEKSEGSFELCFFCWVSLLSFSATLLSIGYTTPEIIYLETGKYLKCSHFFLKAKTNLQAKMGYKLIKITWSHHKGWFIEAICNISDYDTWPIKIKLIWQY